MKLKLKECIRNRGQQYRPGEIIDTQELKISDGSALVLVRRGTAVHVTEEPAAEADDAPEVIELVSDASEPAEPVEPAADPVVSQEPEVINLGDAEDPAAEAAPVATGKKGKRK